MKKSNGNFGFSPTAIIGATLRYCFFRLIGRKKSFGYFYGTDIKDYLYATNQNLGSTVVGVAFIGIILYVLYYFNILIL